MGRGCSSQGGNMQVPAVNWEFNHHYMQYNQILLTGAFFTPFLWNVPHSSHPLSLSLPSQSCLPLSTKSLSDITLALYAWALSAFTLFPSNPLQGKWYKFIISTGKSTFLPQTAGQAGVGLLCALGSWATSHQLQISTAQNIFSCDRERFCPSEVYSLSRYGVAGTAPSPLSSCPVIQTRG